MPNGTLGGRLDFVFIGNALFCDSWNLTGRISPPKGASVSLIGMWPKMDPKHYRSLQNLLKDHSKIKTITCQEPSQWQKSTIGRQKTRKTVKKPPSIGGINREMHSSRQISPINDPDLIGKSQSSNTKEDLRLGGRHPRLAISDRRVVIGGLGEDRVELAMAINDATWNIDQVRRSTAHVTL